MYRSYETDFRVYVFDVSFSIFSTFTPHRAQSFGVVEYTECNHYKSIRPPPMNVRDVTLFPSPLCPGVVAPDRVVSMCQIEQTMCANK